MLFKFIMDSFEEVKSNVYLYAFLIEMVRVQSGQGVKLKTDAEIRKTLIYASTSPSSWYNA
jgi:hypothetical protein